MKTLLFDCLTLVQKSFQRFKLKLIVIRFTWFLLNNLVLKKNNYKSCISQPHCAYCLRAGFGNSRLRSNTADRCKYRLLKHRFNLKLRANCTFKHFSAANTYVICIRRFNASTKLSRTRYTIWSYFCVSLNKILPKSACICEKAFWRHSTTYIIVQLVHDIPNCPSRDNMQIFHSSNIANHILLDRKM